MLPIFPADVTEINHLVAFAKRDGQVYYFSGLMPVFSHAEDDLRMFRMFTSQLVVHGNCTQMEIVRAFGISSISMKRYVKQYRERGVSSFFEPRRGRGKTVLTTEVENEARKRLGAGEAPKAVAAALGIKPDTLHKAIRAGRLAVPEKKRGNLQPRKQQK
jgi:hypothetical protein